MGLNGVDSFSIKASNSATLGRLNSTLGLRRCSNKNRSSDRCFELENHQIKISDMGTITNKPNNKHKKQHSTRNTNTNMEFSYTILNSRTGNSNENPYSNFPLEAKKKNKKIAVEALFHSKNT